MQTDTEYMFLKHYSLTSKVGPVDRNLSVVRGFLLPHLRFTGQNVPQAWREETLVCTVVRVSSVSYLEHMVVDAHV